MTAGNLSLKEINKGIKIYKASLEKVFNSHDGHVVLAWLRSEYVDSTALVTDSNIATGYLLGKKELVQELINSLKDDGVLDEIKIEE